MCIEVGFCDAKLSAELSMQCESEASFFCRHHRFEVMSPHDRGCLAEMHAQNFSR